MSIRSLKTQALTRMLSMPYAISVAKNEVTYKLSGPVVEHLAKLYAFPYEASTTKEWRDTVFKHLYAVERFASYVDVRSKRLDASYLMEHWRMAIHTQLPSKIETSKSDVPYARMKFRDNNQKDLVRYQQQLMDLAPRVAECLRTKIVIGTPQKKLGELCDKMAALAVDVA